MVFNYNDAIKNIVEQKKQWAYGNQEKNDYLKNQAASAAKPYYQQLRDNGYGYIADELDAVDHVGADNVMRKYAKSGMTATRDYVNPILKKYGISDDEAQKIIGWDDATKQVTVGGKNIGSPDMIYDGTSYWNEENLPKLEAAIKNYADRAGITPSEDTMYKQRMQKGMDKNDEQWANMQQNAKDIIGKYYQEIDYLKNTNPFTTDTAKAILAKYDLAGLQSRDNIVAANSGSNGGNIDSYAAANALRQQAALVNQGQMLVLDDHRQKLDHARSLLSDLGVQMSRDYQDQNMNIMTDSAFAQQLFDNKESREQRLFENEQTSRNNQVQNDIALSNLLGTTAGTAMYADNPFFENGKLRDENVDYSDVIAAAQKNGDKQMEQWAKEARAYKLFNNYSKWGQYDDGNYSMPASKQIESGRQFDEQMKQGYAALDLDKYKIDTDASVTKHEINKNAEVQNNATNASLTNSREQRAADAKIGGDQFNMLLQMFDESETRKRSFITKYIKPLYDEGTAITPEELKQLILTNTEEYNIDVDDARVICGAFGMDITWLNKYEDRTGDNKYKGMKKKSK